MLCRCRRFRFYCPKRLCYWVEDLFIDILDVVINKGMRILGPFLALAAVILISLVTYEYFMDIYPYVRKISIDDPIPFLYPTFITLCGLWLLINIAFNHQSCVWTLPGYAPLTLTQYPKGTQHIPQTFYKFDPELKASVIIRYCTDCETYKPWRSHHCSICKRCHLLSIEQGFIHSFVCLLIQMCVENGPSLSMDVELRGICKLSLFLYVSVVFAVGHIILHLHWLSCIKNTLQNKWMLFTMVAILLLFNI